MRVLDLRCTVCQSTLRRAHVEYGETYPRCECGGERVVTWDGGQSPMLDAYSTPKYDDGLGTYVSSTRERESIAKRHGLTPCGDKVGGARQTHELTGHLTFEVGK